MLIALLLRPCRLRHPLKPSPEHTALGDFSLMNMSYQGQLVAKDAQALLCKFLTRLSVQERLLPSLRVCLWLVGHS